MTNTRLYPLQPLLDMIGGSQNAALSKLGINNRLRRQKYLAEGVSEKVADRLATRAGYHPSEVWPEMVDHAIEDAHIACAECSTPFIPRRRDHRFCSRGCVERRSKRKRYAADADYRAKEIARSKAYQAANSRSVKLKGAARYARNRADRQATQARYRQRLREERKAGVS